MDLILDVNTQIYPMALGKFKLHDCIDRILKIVNTMLFSVRSIITLVLIKITINKMTTTPLKKKHRKELLDKKSNHFYLYLLL